MRKIFVMVLVTVLTILMCYNLACGELVNTYIWKCYYPKNSKIVRSELFTGSEKGAGSNKVYLSVDVLYSNNQYVKYIVIKNIKISDIKAMTRLFSPFDKKPYSYIPKKIIFVPWNRDDVELVLEIE